MDTNPIYRALEKRMWHDLAQSLSIGKKAGYVREQLFREAKNLPKEDRDAVLTPLQQSIRDDINEVHKALVSLFAAFDRRLETENMEDDPASAAAVELLGPLVGRIMALEMRVAALEAAVE